MVHTREFKRPKEFDMSEQVSEWQNGWQDDLEELSDHDLYDDESEEEDEQIFELHVFTYHVYVAKELKVTVWGDVVVK